MLPDVAQVRQDAAGRHPGLRVEAVESIGSTSTELTSRARRGDTTPVLLVAARQTAGRGRHGRPWHSGARASLTFSLGLPLAPADWSGLSLAVGVAVAESLHPAIGLKWPNDLWVRDGGVDRKLGGILIETVAAAGATPAAGRYAVIGIGLNIDLPDGEGMNPPPAALQAWLPGIDAAGALARIVPALMDAVQQFAAAGFAPFAQRFAARDVLQGREIVLRPGGAGGAPSAGRAAGVGPGGALLLHTAAGMQTVTSADFSVRPAATS